MLKSFFCTYFGEKNKFHMEWHRKRNVILTHQIRFRQVHFFWSRTNKIHAKINLQNEIINLSSSSVHKNKRKKIITLAYMKSEIQRQWKKKEREKRKCIQNFFECYIARLRPRYRHFRNIRLTMFSLTLFFYYFDFSTNRRRYCSHISHFPPTKIQ